MITLNMSLVDERSKIFCALLNMSQYFGTNDSRLQVSSFQCLKESYVKALGIGIGFEVKRLDFNLKSKLPTDCDPITTTTLRVDGNPAANWVFQESFRDDHCIAVAVDQSQVYLSLVLRKTVFGVSD